MKLKIQGGQNFFEQIHTKIRTFSEEIRTIRTIFEKKIRTIRTFFKTKNLKIKKNGVFSRIKIRTIRTI